MTTDLITVDEAAQLFPAKNGSCLHRESVIRRIRSGCNGVRLQAVKNGKCWFTTQEWIAQFMVDCAKKSVRPARLELEKDRSENYERAAESLHRRYGIVSGSHFNEMSHLRRRA